jgi:hypothetical protein
MTGKNRIRDETTARCTNDTRAFGFKTEQENPPTCMPAGADGRRWVTTFGSILVCASNPSDGMSKFKITVARIEVAESPVVAVSARRSGAEHAAGSTAARAGM